MTLEQEGERAATAFREEHRLGEQPLGDPVALIEQATGCDVAVLDAGPDEHGLTMRDPVPGYIDAVTKQEWMRFSTPRLATRFGWTDRYQSLQNDADRTRAPQRLLTRAVAGFGEGAATIQAIATLRGISADMVAEELAEAGVAPKVHQPTWMAASELPQVTVDLSDLDDEEKIEGGDE